MSDIVSRVMADPLNVAIAMAAGAFGPAIVTKAMPALGRQSMMLAPACGAGAYYLMDEMRDTKSLMIGAAAGYVGPIAKRQIGM